MACGGRLKRSDFSLNHEDASLFAKCQWPIHQYIYLAYRVLLAVYLFEWWMVSVATTVSIGVYFVYFTKWSFTVLTLYAVSSCMGAIHFTFAKSNRFYSGKTASHQAHTTDHDFQQSGSFPTTNDQLPAQSMPEAEQPPEAASGRLPNYFKLVWLLFNLCLTASPVVTVVYWSFLQEPGQSPSVGAVHSHAINSVVIYVDLLFCAIPVRPVHFIYGLIYGAFYVFFTLIYYWAGGLNPFTWETAIYRNVLDWSRAGWTILFIFVVAIAIPVAHLAAYGVYRLRVYVHRRCFDTQHEDRCTADETPSV